MLRLTRRENEILLLRAKALSRKDIAMLLGISESTVKTHLSRIYRKMGVCNHASLINKAIGNGIICEQEEKL